MGKIPVIKVIRLIALITLSGFSVASPPSHTEPPKYTWAGAWEGTFWSSNPLAGSTPFKMILTHSGDLVKGTIEWDDDGVQFGAELQGTVTEENVDGGDYSHVTGTYSYTDNGELIVQDFLMTMLLPPYGDCSEFGGGHRQDAAAHWTGLRSDKIPREHLPVILEKLVYI